MAHRDGLSRKVLLIGWDAADWEHITPLLEEGLMPTLDAFINRGVMGNLATLQPILSPRLDKWLCVLEPLGLTRHS